MTSLRGYDRPCVVTGGSGFLGREVVRQLLGLGCPEVRVVDLNPHPTHAALRSFSRDIRNDDLDDPFEGAGVVLHLAACQYHTPLASSTYRLPFFDVNVEGTRRVLTAARRKNVERVVFVSTNMVYGLPTRLPLAEDHPRRPFGPYARSKLTAEHLVEVAHSNDLQTAIVRPGLLIGPGRVGLIARIFDWIVRGKDIWLSGDGKNRYELTAVEDCARLVLVAGSDRGSHAAFNCGSANVPTMAEWIEAVASVAGSPSRVRGVPAGLVKPALRLLEAAQLSPLRKDQYLLADVDYFLATDAARDHLGWVPSWRGTDAAIAAFRSFQATSSTPEASGHPPGIGR